LSSAPDFRRRAFSVLEMIVSLLILSLFLFIFIQLDYLVKEQNQLLSTEENGLSRGFQVLNAVIEDIHRADVLILQGANGIQLHQGSTRIIWMSVHGTVVRRVDGRKMLEVSSQRLSFVLHGDRTVTVKIDNPPLSVRAVVGGF